MALPREHRIPDAETLNRGGGRRRQERRVWRQGAHAIAVRFQHAHSSQTRRCDSIGGNIAAAAWKSSRASIASSHVMDSRWSTNAPCGLGPAAPSSACAMSWCPKHVASTLTPGWTSTTVRRKSAEVGYPRVRIVAAVVAAGDDEAGVGVELGRRRALVVPASEVFPARNERRGRRVVRRGSIGRVLAERRLVGSRVRGAPSLARA